jgi:hypothetical protein
MWAEQSRGGMAKKPKRYPSYLRDRAGSACLNSFPRSISGLLPGLRFAGFRALGRTEGGPSPTEVTSRARRNIHAAAWKGAESSKPRLAFAGQVSNGASSY